MGSPVEVTQRQTNEEMAGLRGGELEQDREDGRLRVSRKERQPVEDICGGGQIRPWDEHSDEIMDFLIFGSDKRTHDLLGSLLVFMRLCIFFSFQIAHLLVQIIEQ